MTAEDELAWLRGKVAEQASELAELRDHVKAAVGKNLVLVGALRDLADHGTRADLAPTKKLPVTGRGWDHGTVLQNEGWWQGYLLTADAYVRGFARRKLSEAGEMP
jgi:hypothetical protein